MCMQVADERENKVEILYMYVRTCVLGRAVVEYRLCTLRWVSSSGHGRVLHV
jgi:hypothetical protein